MSIFVVFHGGTLSLVIWCHSSWAQPLGWLISKRCQRLQLFSTWVSGTSLMAKILSDHFSSKNVDFRRFSRGYPKFGNMVSLQLSTATWMINTKTLLRTSTILNISSGTSLMDKVLSDHFSCENIDFRRFWRGVPYIWVYSVTSVERGHLADWYQILAIDLNYFQYKLQDYH